MSTKRVLDLIVTPLALMGVLPVLVVVAIAIWLEDGGPIIFKQKRIGRNGKIFQIYKFRKLAHRAESSTSCFVALNDERYSRVGRFLDRTKLNELPQLVNILKGDMTLVGPRPELPEFEKCYSGKFRDLLSYTPGIFGPSQCLFRSEALLYPPDVDMQSFYENVLFAHKAELDLDYYPRATIAGDIYWIVRSIFAVFGLDHSSRVTSEVSNTQQELHQSGKISSDLRR